MCRRIEMFRYAVGLLMLATLLVGCSSCRKTKMQIQWRLSRGGYSPDTKTFLLRVYYDFGELEMKGSYLATYDVEKGLMKPLHLVEQHFFDFAWVPRQPAFVVTHGDGMILFRQDDSDDGYGGMAIRCPTEYLYRFCAWNPEGRWLAVNCHDMEKPSLDCRLGMYDLSEEKFLLSDILMRPGGRPFWKDDATLYVNTDDNIVEVKLESGEPRLVRTIPIEEGGPIFCGMFDDQALLHHYETQITLGNRTLVELDRPAGCRITTTKAYIFISASSENLIVFDHKGREIDRTNPGRTISLGPAGKDPNTVYGLADKSVLLRVCVEDGSLNIDVVCDLADL